MKGKLLFKSTLIIVVVGILIIAGIVFINYGFEKDFIHRLPSVENLDNDSYNLLLNLYQTRVNFGNWIVAIIGALLTFAAFYVQYDYNSKQNKDIVQERYENQLFHLLDVYRDICHNTSIRNVGSGKVVFHYMFYEYKAIFNIIKKSKDILAEITKQDDETINYIAFTYFINGVSANMNDTTIDETIITEKGKTELRDRLLSYQQESEAYDEQHPESGVEYLKDYRHNKIKYFDGHRLRFIPYIKYISLIVSFISGAKCSNDSDVKYLTNEQTDHEIGLIYAYNGFLKYQQPIEHTQVNQQRNAIWELIYNDLPKFMSYKFKYNGDSQHDFLS